MRPVVATYRLQFHRDFPFAAAERIAPYLAALGVSHLYLSPIFAARPGSTHGYDVVDPTRVNPELGGEPAFLSLAGEANRLGLGLILDIVPNHMAADRLNPAWMETLEQARDAPSARYFDIDWGAGKILLPILGSPLDEVLARGELSPATDEATGKPAIAYFEHRFPLRPDGPGPTAPLAEILEAQHWRLAQWRAADRDLTYRRFFNITELVGVRVEDPATFDYVHRLPLDYLGQGLVDGLRVDHVDGLADPEAYCRRLREAAGPDALIVLEKILEGDEELRPWPVDGTTGYDRLNDINGLFIDPDGYRRLDDHLVGRGLLKGDAHDRLRQAKGQVLDEMFGAELARLARAAAPLVPAEAGTLRIAARALAIHSPVYRSYASERGHVAADEAVWQAMRAGIRRHEAAETAATAAALLDAIEAGGATSFAVGLQQLAGPAMAKGLEDTEFYRSVALLSANEVGADLAEPAISIERFHRRNEAAMARRDLVPLATHDTKRGADTRARISLLSANPDATIALMARWSDLVAPLRLEKSAPDALDEWLLLQTLFGAWPVSAERLATYLVKAMREAKRKTRWEAPDEAYEEAALRFARAVVDDEVGEGFRRDLERVLQEMDPFARIASIGQLILQLTIPGIPDTYQGTEFWDHSLVDPDNRRPVDWTAREEALAGGVALALTDDAIGIAKFRTLRRLLALRRTARDLFEGTYEPLAVEQGPARFVAFRRRSDKGSLIVVVPTRPTRLTSCETLAGLPQGRWRNAMTDQAFEIGPDGLTLEGNWPFLVARQENATAR